MHRPELWHSDYYAVPCEHGPINVPSKFVDRVPLVWADFADLWAANPPETGIIPGMGDCPVTKSTGWLGYMRDDWLTGPPNPEAILTFTSKEEAQRFFLRFYGSHSEDVSHWINVSHWTQWEHEFLLELSIRVEDLPGKTDLISELLAAYWDQDTLDPSTLAPSLLAQYALDPSTLAPSLLAQYALADLYEEEGQHDIAQAIRTGMLLWDGGDLNSFLVYEA